jgi:hypothetical protein
LDESEFGECRIRSFLCAEHVQQLGGASPVHDPMEGK